LLRGQPVQVVGHGGCPGRHHGVPVAFEGLDLLLSVSERLQFALGGLAGLLQFQERLVELFVGHMLLRGEPLVSTSLLIYFGKLLQPRLSFACGVAVH